MVAKKTRKTEIARRYRGIRRDTTIKRAETEAARILNLPAGCVRFVLPSGRKARTDKSINAFLKDWGW